MDKSDDGFDAWQVELHGHPVIYRTAGSGPPVVLIHGMVNSSHHWREVALRLADRYTVIAPDLIGHGDSATPRGDYSLGAHAAGIRDVLTALGHKRVTVVGHSLGGSAVSKVQGTNKHVSAVVAYDFDGFTAGDAATAALSPVTASARDGTRCCGSAAGGPGATSRCWPSPPATGWAASCAGPVGRR